MANIDARSCGYQASGIHKFASISEAPPLRIVAHEAAPDGGTDYVFDLAAPGRYTIRVWTNEEWGRLAEAERPVLAYRDHRHERWFTVIAPKAPTLPVKPFDAAREMATGQGGRRGYRA